MWTWASFAVGYVLGGISGILVLGIFMVGARGETRSDGPPENSVRNPVVGISSAQNARKAGPGAKHLKPLPNQPA